MNENVFGENLQELRKNHNLSRKELADKLDLSEQSIHYYETGKRETNFATLLKIADIFNVSTDYLLRPRSISVDQKSADNPVPCSLTIGEFTYNFELPRSQAEKTFNPTIIKLNFPENFQPT